MLMVRYYVTYLSKKKKLLITKNMHTHTQTNTSIITVSIIFFFDVNDDNNFFDNYVVDISLMID